MAEKAIDFGNISNFADYSMRHASVTWLTASKILVAWYKPESNWGGFVRAGTVSGNVLTWGPTFQFLGDYYELKWPVVRRLEDDKALLVWQASDGNAGQACVISISGTDISMGSVTTWGNTDYYCRLSVAPLSPSAAAITYKYSDRVRARILTISGTTVSYGSEYTADASKTPYEEHITALNSTKIVVAFRDANGGYAVIGTISGTEITFGSVSQYFNVEIGWDWVVAIDSSRFVVAYTNSQIGYLRAASVSDSTITWGTAVQYSDNDPRFHSLCRYDDDTVILSVERDAETAGSAKWVFVSGTTITLGSQYYDYNPPPTGQTNYNEIAYNGDASCAVAFRSDGHSQKGYANIGVISEAAVGKARSFGIIF